MTCALQAPEEPRCYLFALLQSRLTTVTIETGVTLVMAIHYDNGKHALMRCATEPRPVTPTAMTAVTWLVAIITTMVMSMLSCGVQESLDLHANSAPPLAVNREGCSVVPHQRHPYIQQVPQPRLHH